MQRAIPLLRRPKRLARSIRPRLATQIDREGSDVILALADQHGRACTIRISKGGAASIGALMHLAGGAASEEECPTYTPDVIGEFLHLHDEHDDNDQEPDR